MADTGNRKPARARADKKDADTANRLGDNSATQPVRTLRAWLDHPAARDCLAVAKPDRALRFELAAIAKHFD